MRDTLPAGFSRSVRKVADAAREKIDLGLQSYIHDATGVRIIFYSAPGPLCAVTIVVPTEAVDNSGHPHCLEHLLFLGSEKHPHRGYLDTLAARCFSDGTNAWTAEDHTAYTYRCAGPDGLLQVLPVFVDHVIFPTLTDAQFANEVHYLMGDGKHAGVVYCEMQSRENSEGDLGERAWRSALFPGTSLEKDTGGLTADIAKLTNEQVCEYHRANYQSGNFAILVGGDAGAIDVDLVLNCTIPVLERLAKSLTRSAHFKAPWSDFEVPQPPLTQPVTRKTVPFPSADEQFGSCILAWRGPLLSDVKAILALTVFTRYLVETAASPMNQQFVERANPLCNALSFELYKFKQTAIVMYASGVPLADDMEADDGSSDENDNEHLADVSESASNLLSHGRLGGLVLSFLEKCAAEAGAEMLAALKRTMKRYRLSILEGLESSKHDMISEVLIPDVVYSEGELGAALADSLAFLSEFEAYAASDWIVLLRTYLIDAPRVEVYMIPDAHLGQQLSAEENHELESRRQQLGKEGLERLEMDAEELAKEIEAARVRSDHLYPSVLSSLTIPRVPYSISRYQQHRSLFQVVQMDTAFVHLYICLSMDGLAPELRSYLPLFLELLFACDLEMNLDDRNGGTYVQTIKWEKVVEQFAESALYMSASAGISGTSFSPGPAPDCLFISAVSQPEHVPEFLDRVRQSLCFGKVAEDRLQGVCKNMYGELIEELRDGDGVADALAVAVCETLGPGGETRTSSVLAMCLFSQIRTLKAILAGMARTMSGDDDVSEGTDKQAMDDEDEETGSESGSEDDSGFLDIDVEPVPVSEVLRNLELLRVHFQIRSEADPLFHVGAKDTKQLVDVCQRAFLSGNESRSTCRIQDLPAEMCLRQTPRSIGAQSASLIVPIAGVESNYFNVFVDCAVPKGHPDYFALEVLTEALSRTEGALYDAVRGTGLAYGAAVYNRIWNGKLVLSVSESVDPCRAWRAVCALLHEIESEFRGASLRHFSQSSLDTARSCVTFNMHDAKRNVSAIFKSTLRSSVLGLSSSVEEELAFGRALDSVDLPAIQRVFAKYMNKLCDRNSRVFVVVCRPDAVDSIMNDFRSCEHPVELERRDLSDLAYQI
ncbi:hypothetical protein FVE85_4512 [Porphyridium purpureum]|uniref:Uncharacterized protein n=1 Tax=Porphyridium purpureum TaxID=35688 RepID=A0A5J4YIW8_PORPP|nr:hypothetical protein FVE85_4512 [Porphyridium purpureum]|eukprot:POR6752..scf297_16